VSGAEVSGSLEPAQREFASDNHAGAHPEVLEAIAAANVGHADSYGADPWTARLQETFRRHFGARARAHPVFNGTGANVLCLELLGRRHEAVICTSDAHINVDECGAPERIAGLKLLTVETEHGKLSAADIGRWDAKRGDQHHVQPRIVSITQSTELGTVYAPDEIAAIADAAHERGMYVHVDGARLANAAAALGLPFAAFTTDIGVDAVSFGGTKNGLLFGEVAVFLSDAADDELVPFARKQLMQLASKMRFVSAQFEALLGDGDLWLASARHANEMAALLSEGVAALDGAEIVHPVEANGVFVRLPKPAIETLLTELPGEHPFYIWDEEDGERSVVRWMCSWDTTAEDIEMLLGAAAEAIAPA
jgi:threonine aldolase